MKNIIITFGIIVTSSLNAQEYIDWSGFPVNQNQVGIVDWNLLTDCGVFDDLDVHVSWSSDPSTVGTVTAHTGGNGGGLEFFPQEDEDITVSMSFYLDGTTTPYTFNPGDLALWIEDVEGSYYDDIGNREQMIFSGINLSPLTYQGQDFIPGGTPGGVAPSATDSVLLGNNIVEGAINGNTDEASFSATNTNAVSSFSVTTTSGDYIWVRNSFTLGIDSKVPEPSSALLAGLGLAMGLLRRRR